MLLLLLDAVCAYIIYEVRCGQDMLCCRACVCMCVYTYIYTHLHVYVCLCVYIYIYIYCILHTLHYTQYMYIYTCIACMHTRIIYVVVQCVLCVEHYTLRRVHAHNIRKCCMPYPGRNRFGSIRFGSVISGNKTWLQFGSFWQLFFPVR